MARPYLIGSLMSAGAALVGSLGTKPTSAWYRGLDRPPWEPPPIAFPLVWTPLYGLIAWSAGRGLDRAPAQDRSRLTALLAADLAANAGWCWAFFTGESTRGGLAVIGVLDVLNLAVLRDLARHDRTAAAGFAPYVAWCGFATALNADIARRNW